MFNCPSLSDNYIALALLLNVRSIVPKIPDIKHDDCLKCGSILCFTETWLTCQQTSPVLRENHTIIRSDRLSGDNKGDVVISVPQTMQPSQVTEFTVNGIEAVTTTVLLLNSSYFQLCVIYRPPSTSIDALVTVMSIILSRVTLSDILSVVMGDFNENLLLKPGSRLLSLMLHYKFS